jgi:dimethylargininase
MYQRAIVRRPGVNFSKGISTSLLGSPDIDLARMQHTEYIKALEMAGIKVTILEADENYPDGCFVEDTAVITEEIAIISRPGAGSRQGEEAETEKVISSFRKTVRILAPGTLDGGDVMRSENHFYIGLSERTNKEGAGQLGRILRDYGYTYSFIEVKDGLHLKSGVSYIGYGNFVVTSHFKKTVRAGIEILLPAEEDYAANTLFINGTLLIARGFPFLKKAVEEKGYKTVELDMSEFRKMDGGLTCLSLLLR